MLYQAAIQLVSFLSLALFLWIGAVQVLQHRLTIGRAGLLQRVGAARQRSLVGPVVVVGPAAVLDHSAWPAQRHPRAGTRAGRRSLGAHPGEICVRACPLPADVFQLPRPARAPVLDEIDFEVQPGTRVAIVGAAGRAKPR